MKQRLPRVPRGRSGFVLGLVLIVAALVAPDKGRAQSATLIFEDVCGDPSNVFDYQWATVIFNASDLFFMNDDGSVVRVSEGDGDFDGYERLYVFAHGGSDYIGGMNYATFVDGLKKAHPKSPKNVLFGVCDSATKDDSLLKKTNDKYDNKIDKLSGSDDACRLTGNGKYGLKDAEYRVGSKPTSGKDTEDWDKIWDNIKTKWKTVDYGSTGKTYAKYCEDVVAKPFEAGKLRAFMPTVITDFSHVDINPKTSTDYLKLVELNKGGTAQSVCGKDPTGGGPVPCL